MKINNIYLSIYLSICIAIIGCSKENKELQKELQKDFQNIELIELSSERVSLKMKPKEFFRKMLKMSYVDSLLIINDINPFYSMKIVNLRTNEVRNFGKKGRGPNEFQIPYTKCSIDYINNRLFVNNLDTYFIYNVDSLKNGNNSPTLKYKETNKINIFSSATYSNGYIIGTLDNKRFGSYNLTDKIDIEKYDYQKGKGPLSDQYCFNSHPSKSKAVGVQLYSEIISILEMSNNDIHLNEFIWWQNTNKQKQEGNGITRNTSSPDDKNCFLDVTTTENHIYVLYSGKPYGNTKESVRQSYSSNSIYVFDWKGKPVKKYKLDKKVISITMDDKNKVLFAGSYENLEPCLLKFKL